MNISAAIQDAKRSFELVGRGCLVRHGEDEPRYATVTEIAAALEPHPDATMLLTAVSEAVERYKELKPDLTTMDLVMPFKNGIEATREILRVDSKAVVVMCSALGQEALVMEAIEAGAMDFIMKPPRAEDVLAVVKKVLGEA